MASGNESSMTLSTLISKSLCLSGFSSYSTYLAKNKTLVLYHMFLSLTDELQRIEGGSVAEGTVTSESDSDCMIVVPGVIVKASVSDIKDKDVEGDVFFLDTSESQPGYARLRLLKLSDTGNRLLDGYKAATSELLEQSKEKEFLSSENFVNFFTSVSQMKDSYRHGPCTSTEHVDIHGYSDGIPGRAIETDTAHALQCLEWPVEAKEWTTRHRLHDWPTKYLLEKIGHTKCYVVPVGNPLSQHYTQEWRISFLLGERELVWSFNDTQIHCYFVLKRMVKLFLDKIAPEQISSYNMKTLVFWISEQKGLSIWFPGNLLGCIDICLERLRECVSGRKLNHFFNCRANLFGHKFQNEAQREALLKTLDALRANLSSYVLQCIPVFWKWPHAWEKCASDITCLTKLSKDAEVLVGNNFKTVEKGNKVLRLYRVMFNILLQVTANETEPEYILRKLIALENNPPEDVDFDMIQMTKIFLDMRLAMAYFREITVHENEAFQLYIKSRSVTKASMVKMISHACLMDAMSGHLYLASIHHFLGKFSSSVEVIETLLHQHKHLIYPGWGSKYKSIRLRSNGVSNQEMGMKLQGEEGRTFVAYDVIFSHKDVHCVPYPVKFECAIAQFDREDDFLVIHPSVYAYFLLCYGHYLSGKHSKFKEALNLLQLAVDETTGGRERHHALNILSFCYLLDCNLQKAFELLTESLQETEKLGDLSNAAAYHIAIVLYKLFMKQYGA